MERRSNVTAGRLRVELENLSTVIQRASHTLKRNIHPLAVRETLSMIIDGDSLNDAILDVVEVRALRGLREECPPPSEARHSTDLTEQTTSELQNVGSCMGNSIRQPDDVYLEDDIANNPMSFDFEDLQWLESVQ
jgi:hypothetical protein